MLPFLQAGMGWAIGAAAPGSDRRLRIWCTLAAILPGAEVLFRLAGSAVYEKFHLVAAHGALAGLLCLAACGWAFRRYPDRAWLAAMAFVVLSFALHLGVDLLLSGRTLAFLWPLSRQGFRLPRPLEEGSVPQRLAQGVLLVFPCVVLFWRKVTPLELVSPPLDDLFLSLIRPRKHACSECGRKCNHRCRSCVRPVCLRHARVGAHFRITCRACTREAPPKPASGGLEDSLARELSFVRSKEAFKLDPEFAAFLDRKLSDGLKRLDEVPRSHPLWKGSDLKPTVAKLADLCRTLLAEAPDDDEARWVLFAHQVITGSADLGYSALEPLLLRDLGSLRWLVSAARWSYAASGLDPVVALRGPFEHLGKTVGSLEACFQALAQDPNPRTREAATICLGFLHGRNPFDPSSRKPEPARPAEGTAGGAPQSSR